MTTMRGLSGVLCAALTPLLLGGCLALSANPLYDAEQPMEPDDSLLGAWGDPAAEGPYGRWVFESFDKERGYRLRIEEAGEPATLMRAAIVKVGDREFLDLFAQEVDPEPALPGWFALHLRRLHSFVRLERQGPDAIALSLINPGELEALLAEDPGAVAHQYVQQPPGMRPSRMLMLTGEPAALRSLLAERLTDERFFAERRVLRRTAPDAGGPEN